jgi:hypothetical protein
MLLTKIGELCRFVRTLRNLILLFGLLIAVGAGGVAVTQLGVSNLGSFLSGLFRQPDAEGLRGACNPDIGFGPGPMCDKCLSQKRKDCYGAEGPVPRLDCRDGVLDDEVLKTVRLIAAKLRELQQTFKANLKKDDEFMDKHIDKDSGRCKPALKPYLEGRVKDLKMPNLGGALEGLDNDATCVRQRYSKASKRREAETDPKLRALLDRKTKNLEAAANDLENAMKDITILTEINQTLKRYDKYISYCSENG